MPKRSFLLLALVASIGCGGGGSDRNSGGTEFDVESQSLPPGATTKVTLTQTRYRGASLELTVVDGGDDGAAFNDAAAPDPTNGIASLYTAPATPGRYRIQGAVIDSGGTRHLSTKIITVTAVQTQS